MSQERGSCDGLDVQVGVVIIHVRAQALDGFHEPRVRLVKVGRRHHDRGPAVAGADLEIRNQLW